MRVRSKQDEDNEIRNIWPAICFRMNERKLTPRGLASRTKKSKSDIERGIAGEPVPIDLGFLRDCVLAFGLPMGRAENYEETVKSLTWDECMGLIKPPPAMPPRQDNFWDYDD